MGGYSTSDRRSVKWGMLYRSDSIAKLSSADLATIKNLSLKAVTDFRSDTERTEALARLPYQSPAINYRTLAINNPAVDVAKLGRKFYSGQLTQDELLALIDRRAYVNNETLSNAWGEWIRDLARPANLPHLFHCTAGKDRTGFAAAMLLLTLGVPKETVMQDFMLSNQYLEEKIESNVVKIKASSKTDVDAKVLRQVIGVSPESLTGAFAAMETKYGSIDAYIEQGLGIDRTTREKLRSLLLE